MHGVSKRKSKDEQVMKKGGKRRTEGEIVNEFDKD